MNYFNFKANKEKKKNGEISFMLKNLNFVLINTNLYLWEDRSSILCFQYYQ